MIQGKVKWFSDKLGYGFIESEELDSEVFFHFSSIQMKGHKCIEDGTLVKFELDEESGKAIKVYSIQSENEAMQEVA